MRNLSSATYPRKTGDRADPGPVAQTSPAGAVAARTDDALFTRGLNAYNTLPIMAGRLNARVRSREPFQVCVGCDERIQNRFRSAR